MRRFFKDSFTPSMVVALLALVLAVSGTSYAAIALGHGSVSSPEIRDHSVKPVDLKAGPGQPVLGPGQKMVGYFGAAAGDSTAGYGYEAITFPAKLPANFKNGNVQYLDPAATTIRCPGPGEAKRGWACFYVGQVNGGMDLCCIYDQNYNSNKVADFGARIYWYPEAPGNYVDGQWVIRAP